MKLSKGNRDLILHGSLVKAVFAIAIPVVVNSFLQTMYNLTDTYWLGQLSVDYLAAINLVSPVQNTVINFGSGVTVAGAVMISQYIGAGKPEMARKIANQIFTVAMLFSLLCASVMAVATPGIVGWMGAAPDYFGHAVTYMRLVVLDMPFLFMVNIYQSIRQAQGDTVRPMLLNLLGIAVNMPRWRPCSQRWCPRASRSSCSAPAATKQFVSIAASFARMQPACATSCVSGFRLPWGQASCSSASSSCRATSMCTARWPWRRTASATRSTV